jgi:hypothetical protein
MLNPEYAKALQSPNAQIYQMVL